MTYDEIYEDFIHLSGYDISDLPKHDKLIYQLIESGITKYNNKAKKYPDILKGNVKCDRNTETIDKELNDTDLMVLIYFMCEIIASNKLIEYTSLWGTVAHETGFKEYKAQVTAKQQAIDYFRKQIDTLIEDEITDFDYN